MGGKYKPATCRFFVKNEEGNYVNMDTLTPEEQQRHRQNITDTIMGHFGFERDEHPEQPAREDEIKVDAKEFLTSVYGPKNGASGTESAASDVAASEDTSTRL